MILAFYAILVFAIGVIAIVTHHGYGKGMSDLREIIELLHHINRKADRIMAALDDLKAAVTAEQTVEASAITLLQGLAAQLAALVAASNGSVAAADIENVVSQINTNATALAAAVTANTPAPPAPAA